MIRSIGYNNEHTGIQNIRYTNQCVTFNSMLSVNKNSLLQNTLQAQMLLTQNIRIQVLHNQIHIQETDCKNGRYNYININHEHN